MQWLHESWYLLIPSPWVQMIIAPLAAICGGLIGMEREAKEKPAGLRTLSLVCLGSCVFTLVSYAFNTTTGDSGRVAAQIVTGIGFLGGGMLMRGPAGVHGVTTAATIWVVAALGIVIGTGHCVAGLALTILIVGVLRTVGAWEQTRFGGGKEVAISVVFDRDRGKTAIKIEHAFEEVGILRKHVAETDAGEGRLRWSTRVRLSERKRHSLLLNLAEMPEVYAIEE